MTDTSPKISIIIVTHNTQSVLNPFLRSLKISVEQLTAQIIFVDNASVDNSVSLISTDLPQATLIQNRINLGFGRAVNQGARLASQEWLLLLNPDLELEPDCLKNLIDHAARYDDLGLATGRISFPDGSFQAVCRSLPTLGNLIFSRGFFLSRLFGKSQSYTLGDFDSDTPVPALAGTMMLVKRSVWAQLGGFDERFFMFMEDTDLSRRAIEAGLTNRYIPSARATHEWGRGSSIGRQLRRYYHHLSLWLYFRKHNSWLVAWTVVPCLLMINFMMGLILPNKRSN